MKSLSILRVIFIAFAGLAIATSCTKVGPQGPAGENGTNGTDGTNGVDGNVTCLVCHSGNNMEEKKAEFAMSEHSVAAVALSEGGRASCARCHCSQGFVEYATLGTVVGDIANPQPWECSTCHGLHQTFEAQDYALRLSDPVVSVADGTTTLDLNGNSNLCANCHQARTAPPNIASPGDTYKITNTHYGPHHGPQANVVYGIGFAEIPGSVAYPAAGSSKHLAQASCTGCHMADFTNGEGGHSLIPSLAACNACHGANETDYNHGGVQTIVQQELDQLRDKLVSLGVVEQLDDGTYEVVTGTYPMVQAEAYFNWAGLSDDRSLGVHNPPYVKALLLNSIEALNN